MHAQRSAAPSRRPSTKTNLDRDFTKFPLVNGLRQRRPDAARTRPATVRPAVVRHSLVAEKLSLSHCTAAAQLRFGPVTKV